MGHSNEHGGVSQEDEYREPQNKQEELNRLNAEREAVGLPRLSYLCVAYGMSPTTYRGGED